MGWREEGVTLRLYVSESGDFVSLGTRTEYPFTPGGNGLPTGWTMYLGSGASSANVNWTTSSLGRFSISNAMAGNPNINYNYGARLNVPAVRNFRYIVSLQAQVMDGKQVAQRWILNRRLNTGSAWAIVADAVSPWENISLYSDFVTTDDTLQIELAVRNLNTEIIDWGVQFQNVAVTAIPSLLPSPVWHEVTCEVRSLQTQAGRERVTSRYEVGTASIGILNDDGEFTYRPNHPWGLRPGRFVKVEAYVGTAGPYPVYYGLIDGFQDTYTLDGHALQVMNCVDISSLLSNMTVPSMSDIGTIQKSGYRFKQVLDGVGWHPSQVSRDTGVFGQQGIVASGRTVRDELGLIADSEGSYFWADKTGMLVYRDRNAAPPEWTQVQAELLARDDPDSVSYDDVQFIFPGLVQNHMVTPHSNALMVTGDMTIVVRMAVDQWARAGTQTIVSKYLSSLGFSYNLDKGAATKRFNWWIAGGSRATTVDIPVADGQVFWLKCDYVRSTGRVQFFYAIATSQDDEPTAWTQLGPDQTASTAGNTVGTAPVAIGSRPDATLPYGGRISRVIIRTGSTTVLDVSEADAYGQPGTLAFTAATGQPLTVQQAGWVIVRDASYVESGLPVVDDIPTANGAPVVCMRELQTAWSRDRVINEVSLSNQGGNAITVRDDASQKKYGPRTYQRMDFLNDNAHPEYISQRATDIMDGYSEAVLRVNSVAFVPRGTETIKWALRSWLNDLVRVRYEHPTQGWGYAAVVHVQGKNLTVNKDDWSLALALDDMEAFTYYVAASTTSGWDIGLWDEDIWDGAGDPSTPAFWNAGYAWSDPNSKWG